jgi:ribonuclease Z
VQRYAKLELGNIHLLGYSVAGEESVVQIPELDVCFDIGRCPFFALTSNYVCITHGHMDHIAGVAYYLSQRSFQDMRPGTILLPAELAGPVESVLRCWRSVERQNTPYELVPMRPGQDYPIRRDFLIRAVETHHGGGSLGYCLISVRQKLKPEYSSLTGPQLVELKRQGVEIQYRTEVPLVAYLGDTAAGPVFDYPSIRTAQVLITECTFFDPAHRTRAKAGKHLHVEQLLAIIPRLANEHLVLTHVTRRTSLRRARSLLRKRLGEELAGRVHFLMDLEDATDAGDIEATLPPLPESTDSPKE